MTNLTKEALRRFATGSNDEDLVVTGKFVHMREDVQESYGIMFRIDAEADDHTRVTFDFSDQGWVECSWLEVIDNVLEIQHAYGVYKSVRAGGLRPREPMQNVEEIEMPDQPARISLSRFRTAEEIGTFEMPSSNDIVWADDPAWAPPRSVRSDIQQLILVPGQEPENYIDASVTVLEPMPSPTTTTKPTFRSLFSSVASLVR